MVTTADQCWYEKGEVWAGKGWEERAGRGVAQSGRSVSHLARPES